MGVKGTPSFQDNCHEENKKAMAENITLFYSDNRFNYFSTPLTTNLIFNDLCFALRRETSFGGTPCLSITSQRSSRGNLSKVLARSIRRSHVSRPCSARFFISCFKLKIKSKQPRIRREPFSLS